MSRIINDHFDVAELAHHGPENLFLALVLFIGSFIILSMICLPLTLIIFVAVPLIIFFAFKMRSSMNSAFKKSREQPVRHGGIHPHPEKSVPVGLAKGFHRPLQLALRVGGRRKQDGRSRPQEAEHCTSIVGMGLHFLPIQFHRHKKALLAPDKAADAASFRIFQKCSIHQFTALFELDRVLFWSAVFIAHLQQDLQP